MWIHIFHLNRNFVIRIADKRTLTLTGLLCANGNRATKANKHRESVKSLRFFVLFASFLNISKNDYRWRRNSKEFSGSLTLPAPCSILMWNDSSIFWVVRPRDMRAHTHRAPIDWDFGAVRPLRSTQNLNAEMVICHFDWLPATEVLDSNSMTDPPVNLSLTATVAVCHHLTMDVFALDRVWPKRNCCLMILRHRVS